jgi:hypothetical protein
VYINFSAILVGCREKKKRGTLKRVSLFYPHILYYRCPHDLMANKIGSQAPSRASRCGIFFHPETRGKNPDMKMVMSVDRFFAID